MINVLTIEREYGSGANEIARRVAERLGWSLWDQALTTEVARMLECDCKHIEKQEERRDPLYYRLFKSFLRGSYEGSLASPTLKLADAEAIRCATEKLVNKVAKEGKCVIVGRGSAYYLSKSPDAFHVFVYAPFEDKVRRLKDQGKSEAEAVSLAETVDVDRADFIRQHFGVDWPARHYFHLMVNSAMGEETVVETILDGLKLYAARAIEHR
jgi:cytidylate kinase